MAEMEAEYDSASAAVEWDEVNALTNCTRPANTMVDGTG